LDWDSSFFARRIGRILPTRITEGEFEQSILWAHANEIECLYFLCETTDDMSVRTAEKHNFHLVDLRVTKEKWVETGRTSQLSETDQIRPVQSDDVRLLKTLASVSHTDTRFYFDGNFRPEHSAALYELWLEKSCAGWADMVFVGCDADVPVGYISCHVDTPQVGRIGLIAVASSAKGRGLGRSLVERALTWFGEQRVSKVTVVTQGRNIAAQCLYERCGFRTQNVQLWYHGWKPFEIRRRTSSSIV
jgi:dTDP-4-amino-4,6-dideoxy-D-galactose acyltransferase